MPYLVNGQIASEELIREESDRLLHDARWHRDGDAADRAQRLRTAAEFGAR